MIAGLLQDIVLISVMSVAIGGKHNVLIVLKRDDIRQVGSWMVLRVILKRKSVALHK